MTVVYVHGGVSGIPDLEPVDLGFAVAAAAGAGTALDAVEAAIRSLEDHPRLNAGHGSTVNRDGELELDAGLADGATGRVGAVANVRVEHPITLARRVLEDTPHLLIAGRGAEELGSDMRKLDELTPAVRARLERARADGSLDLASYGDPEDVDTVGAVALDGEGNLAAGSSTGGVFGKMRGRVGDSPVFGAGFYAARDVAVVGTGVGEVFLKVLACLRVAWLVEEGVHPQEACEQVVALVRARADVPAGLLALDVLGRSGAAFRGGSLGVAGPDGLVEPVKLF